MCDKLAERSHQSGGQTAGQPAWISTPDGSAHRAELTEYTKEAFFRKACASFYSNNRCLSKVRQRPIQDVWESFKVCHDSGVNPFGTLFQYDYHFPIL